MAFTVKIGSGQTWDFIEEMGLLTHPDCCGKAMARYNNAYKTPSFYFHCLVCRGNKSARQCLHPTLKKAKNVPLQLFLVYD